MVKKKTRRKIVKPPQPKLDTVFNCLLCGHKKSVVVKFNRKEKKGYLRCKVCSANFETNIFPADAYIDVYYRWVDEIEKERDKSSSEEEDDKNSKNKEKEYEEEEAADSESEKNKSEDNYEENNEEKEGNEEDEEQNKYEEHSQEEE